jgi:hypothetical protein
VLFPHQINRAGFGQLKREHVLLIHSGTGSKTVSVYRQYRKIPADLPVKPTRSGFDASLLIDFTVSSILGALVRPLEAASH